MRKLARLASVSALALAIVAAVAPVAHASFPGQDKVAFVRYNGENFRIFEMRPNGSEQRRVFGPETEEELLAAAMSPNGRWVVFNRSDGGQYDLFLLRVGGNTRRVTDTPNRNEHSPMWTPDGERIVFMETDDTTYSAIVLRDADGTHRREVDRSTSDYLLYPSVSPNGARVLYSAPRADVKTRGLAPYDLVTRKLDGTGRRWLTETPAAELAGDWAPDGERVAYLRYDGLMALRLGTSEGIGSLLRRRGDAELPVYSIRSEGGGRRLISDKPNIYPPVRYTPDGKRVMFSRLTSESFDLFSTLVEGGVLKRLTETTETYNVFDLYFLLLFVS